MQQSLPRVLSHPIISYRIHPVSAVRVKPTIIMAVTTKYRTTENPPSKRLVHSPKTSACDTISYCATVCHCHEAPKLTTTLSLALFSPTDSSSSCGVKTPRVDFFFDYTPANTPPPPFNNGQQTVVAKHTKKNVLLQHTLL